MKRRLLFLGAVFFATLVLLVVQKPVFLLYYRLLAEGATLYDWFHVILNGLRLDLTVAGYITLLPLLLVFLSLWVQIAPKIWRRIFDLYFICISLFSALIVAVDLGLYEHWGFRIDGTILIYLADPREALNSIDLWLGVRQTLFFALYAGVMIWVYRSLIKLFDGEPVRRRGLWSGAVLLLGGLLFLAIRGGVGASVANISKVYFSSNMFLNHAATNPLFSFLSSLGNTEDYATCYPFFDAQQLRKNFDPLRGNGAVNADTIKVLNKIRPNVVVVILESFGRTVMDETVAGEPVMPNLQRLKREGIFFENFYANSFRTDRGEVAILNGFPAQTQMSIMKLPIKNRSLPSLARSLGAEGYSSAFYYGGDLNFTNQASYMYATGWQRLIWQRDLGGEKFPPPGDWGYADDVMTDYFARQVIARSRSEKPFLAGLLTLSSHVPFDVPYSKFEDKMLNSMAFSDDCIGRMIATLKGSPAWDNLLVVLVADHTYPYPYNIPYNVPQRHHIPMLWLGGAITKPRIVSDYASQIDICATILGQLGVDHSDYDYSKDIFNGTARRFGYYVFNEGFGVVDASGEAVYDLTGDRVVSATNPALLELGRTMLQTTYEDIGAR